MRYTHVNHQLSPSSWYINLLAPGKFSWNFKLEIFKQSLVTDGWGISCEIALIWISLDFTDDQSILVQVMAWCRQATSHYLSQCWPRSMPLYGVTRRQWVNSLWPGESIWGESLSKLVQITTLCLRIPSHHQNKWWLFVNEIPGLILGLHPANERQCYKVTPSLIGWAQTKNQPKDPKQGIPVEFLKNNIMMNATQNHLKFLVLKQMPFIMGWHCVSNSPKLTFRNG